MSLVGSHNRKKSEIFGLLSIILFISFLVLFASLYLEFNFKEDFVSKLGAKGEPLAICWNVIGLGLVGVTLIGFGYYYVKTIQDNVAGLLLAFFWSRVRVYLISYGYVGFEYSDL